MEKNLVEKFQRSPFAPIFKRDGRRSSRDRRRGFPLCFSLSEKIEREKRKGLMEEETRDGKKRKKKNEKKKKEEPTDEEVDEFFRILKRMHVALEYFGGVKSKLLSSAAMADIQQGLDEEEEEDDDDDEGKREKLVEEICEKEEKKIKSWDGTLDLNADPK